VRRYLQVLGRFYDLLLNLFPGKYREEYGEELRVVFNLALDEALKKGKLEAASVVLRELVSLPKAIILAYLRERKNAKMTKTIESYFNFAYGSWKEFLTTILPFFLLGGALPVINFLGRQKLIQVPDFVTNGIMLGLLGLFVILFLAGLVKGLPRWSLPYLGFALSLFSAGLFGMLIGLWISFVFPKFLHQPSLLADIVYDGLFWFGQLITMLSIVAVTRISPRLQRFRDDWTLLCFILYGAVPFVFLLSFDDYAGDEPYTLLAFLVLASGAWFYLRIHNEWKRFGVLFAALSLVILIAAVGKVMLIPVQDWAVQVEPFYWRSELRHTFFTWLWLAVSMLVPALIKVLPQLENASDDSEVLT
jgi:hypothetical protein